MHKSTNKWQKYRTSTRTRIATAGCQSLGGGYRIMWLLRALLWSHSTVQYSTVQYYAGGGYGPYYGHTRRRRD